jgi:hypothetical protein
VTRAEAELQVYRDYQDATQGVDKLQLFADPHVQGAWAFQFNAFGKKKGNHVVQGVVYADGTTETGEFKTWPPFGR